MQPRGSTFQNRVVIQTGDGPVPFETTHSSHHRWRIEIIPKHFGGVPRLAGLGRYSPSQFWGAPISTRKMRILRLPPKIVIFWIL